MFSVQMYPVSFQRFCTRIQRLGGLSLAALLLGGSLLIFVSANALGGPRTREDRVYNYDIHKFRYGRLWNIQAWTAITGIGIGLISYGLSEAYNHLFDWWCSRQARTEAGLDYGRYLNTLPRAPVFYGARGFPLFITLHHAVALLMITGSIGYKFGLMATSAELYTNADAAGYQPSLRGQHDYGRVSGLPWFADVSNPRSTCFTQYENAYRFEDERVVPKTSDPMDVYVEEILMAGAMCGDTHSSAAPGRSGGAITSREVVMVAHTQVDNGSFTMSRDGGWASTETRSSQVAAAWVPEGEPAVVQYRGHGQDELQVQWGRLGSWYRDADSNETQPVVRRLTFKIRYAVAEVTRAFPWSAGDDCMYLESLTGTPSGFVTMAKPVRLLSTDESTLSFNDTELQTAMTQVQPWIDALLWDPVIDSVLGVSAIVQAFMWSTVTKDQEASRSLIRLVPDDELPYGPEDDSETLRRREFPHLKYPFFTGHEESDAIGCHMAAIVCFAAVGLLAVVTAVVRVAAGPPELTSWTAQHLYLMRAGAAFVDDSQETPLASGYSVAPSGLGRIWIGKKIQPEEETSLMP